MSFKTIYRLNKRKDEKIFLMGPSKTMYEDELGFAKRDFVELWEIDGIIQGNQQQDIDFKGEESNPIYIGYFMPDFIMETDKVADYKIKYKRPHETLILKIAEYNQNLFLKGNRDHIQLKMILEKKYNEGN